MKLLRIICLLCFLTLTTFVNAESNTGKAFIHGDVSDEVPRVKIKVFRGPSKEQDGEQFVTWGFWIKQPATIKLTR